MTLGTASVKARAGADGRWSATLPALAAGGPYTLTAAANGDARTASDVLVGDVFLCAGQSNMGFGQRQSQGAADDARTATDGQIRQLNMRTTVTLTADHAAKAGAVLDRGSVNEEDETWVNGKDVGASSFANRTQHQIRPGVLKAGVNVIATNIF